MARCCCRGSRPLTPTTRSKPKTSLFVGALACGLDTDFCRADYAVQMPPPVEVIRSPEVRSLLAKAFRPALSELGFKQGKSEPGGWSGWVRETSALREFFWVQLSQSGFDRYSGGQFIVEFTLSDPARRTGLRDRMWRLLDDVSRREVVRINNAAIASLPGPSHEILNALPESLRSTYVASFETIDETPGANQDVWFRYATRGDVVTWGEFIDSRFRFVIQECERRIAAQEPGTGSIGGVAVNRPSDG